MIRFDAWPVLSVAAVLWLAWRLIRWRRLGGDALREAGLVVLLIWALAAVRVTFFPIRIIFYDWYGSSSLVPFQSTVQLLTETPLRTALVNIVGNLLLFMPFGFLMPLLFAQVRGAWAVLWRALAASLAIEVVQIATRARATDVDDVIINAAGAMAGYLVYRIAVGVVGRSPAFGRILVRLAASPKGEPLVPGAILFGATLAITAPFMASSILASTIGEGSEGIEADAAGRWPGATLAARAGAGLYEFLVVETSDGLGVVHYERVLPGRYTWVGSSDPAEVEGSHFNWSISAFNVSREELPAVVVWGANEDGANRLLVDGNGARENLPIGGGTFAAAFLFDVYADVEVDSDGILDDFGIRFVTPDGEDVSDQFASLRG